MIVSCNCKKVTVTEENTMSKKTSFEVLSESAYQGKEEEAFEIIKDDAALKELYQSINNESIPRIDFTKETVVAAFLGQKNSGGYAIKIKNVIEKDDKIYIEVEKISPQPGQGVTMAMTNPYSIVKINSTKTIIFK